MAKRSTTSQRRSVCPVACTLDLIGDKWTLLVVRDLLSGKTTFQQFSQSPERIATNILTDRLNRLVESGLVDRTATDDGRRSEYRLTDKGMTLVPVLQSMADWGLKHIAGTAARVKVAVR